METAVSPTRATFPPPLRINQCNRYSVAISAPVAPISHQDPVQHKTQKSV